MIVVEGQALHSCTLRPPERQGDGIRPPAASRGNMIPIDDANHPTKEGP